MLISGLFIQRDGFQVLDSGEVVQYDHPHSLLQNGAGAFHQMVRQLGDTQFSHLAAVAEDAYHSKWSFAGGDGAEVPRPQADTDSVSVAGASETGHENPAYVID